MKYLIALLFTFTIISCGGVEERIKDHSYTNEWHFENAERFQVYKTKSGQKYIIVLNRSETKFKRKYLK
jgi:hypothetical protein